MNSTPLNKIAALLLILFTFSMAQEKLDVVYLKNGDILRGSIFENVLNDHLRIEISGGSLITIKYSEIAKLTREYPSINVTQKPTIETSPVDTFKIQAEQSQTEFELKLQSKDTVAIIENKATIIYVGDPWAKSSLWFSRAKGVSKNPRGPFTDLSIPISRGGVFYLQVEADLFYKVEVVQEIYNSITLKFTDMRSEEQ